MSIRQTVNNSLHTTMQSKIAFFFLVSFFFVQFVAASPRVVRDTPAEESKNVFDDLKTNVDKFFKETLQVDKLIDGLPEKMKEFGETLKSNAEELAKNFKKTEGTA